MAPHRPAARIALAIAVVMSGALRLDAAPTFTHDVAPILFEHCGQCHHPDGAAPFSLVSYDAAKRRARLIADATASRLMPPWKSEPGYGDFVGQRFLSDAEILTLREWSEAGAPEGDAAALPAMPQWTKGWQLGVPDLVVEWPRPYEVRADGPDFSRTFVLRLPIVSARYVRGFEFQPGGRAGLVHHANIRIDRTSGSRALDDEDPLPGYEGLLRPSAVYPDGYFLGWTPGQAGPLLPDGQGWLLEPGTDVVVEMHFVPDGRVESIAPKIGMYFGAKRAGPAPVMLRLGRQSIDIPAGEASYSTMDAFTLPVAAQVAGLQPHAHYLAREVRGVATLPNGEEQTLLLIRDWDSRWQRVYRPESPRTLPKGTTISMSVRFDNSASNLRNPFAPPRRVQWGQQSTEEMGDLWVQLQTKTAAERRVLDEAIRPKETAEEIVGYEMMIARQPDKVSLHNDVAVMYDELGRYDRAASHFADVVRVQPSSAPAHYNLATALLSDGDNQSAIEHYRTALALHPGYAQAEFGLGRARLAVGQPVDAVVHLTAAVRLTGGNDAEVLDVLAAAHAALGHFDQALQLCDRALALRPEAALATAIEQRRSSYLRRKSDAEPRALR